jgi:hypothetical protein
VRFFVRRFINDALTPHVRTQLVIALRGRVFHCDLSVIGRPSIRAWRWPR